MLVDDGFSVLDTDCGIIGERKAVNEVKVVKVPIGQIFPNPYQPRKSFDEAALEELSASIAQYGVLQPLLVSPTEDGRYLLIAGERRLRASRMAKLTEVPVIISDYTTQQIAEIALIENLQREDLHFLEEAEGYEQLMEQFHLTQEAMAARVGKKQSTIANKLRLLRLSPAVRKVLVSGGAGGCCGQELQRAPDRGIYQQAVGGQPAGKTPPYGDCQRCPHLPEQY